MLFGLMDFGELCFWWLIILGLFGVAVKAMVKKAAGNETIKKAAKKGATDLLSRLFKK